MHVHGRAGTPKQLARNAKNPGKTFGFAAERTGTELFDVFPMFLKVRKGPNGCFRKQLNRSLIGGEHVAFASLQRIIPPKALIQCWHSPFRHRFHASLCLMMARQVLALAVARFFGLTPFGGDAVPHRCDESRYPAGLQADVESHEFPGLLGYVSSVNPISSSGVQIVGGSKPAFLQTLSIRLRRVAFAMCLKYQVNRYFTPLVAAMEMCEMAYYGCFNV
jgi:hypothetical protein